MTEYENDLTHFIPIHSYSFPSNQSMHFENISPNVREENDSIQLMKLTDLEENTTEEEVDFLRNDSSMNNCFLTPPTPGAIFHTPRHVLPFSRMSFAVPPPTNGPIVATSSSTSLMPSSAASMDDDINFGDWHSKGTSSTQTSNDNHFVRNPVAEMDCLEPLPVNQYSYFRNVSWSEDPAFCNEVFY